MSSDMAAIMRRLLTPINSELITAARAGNKAQVLKLLAKGANINATSTNLRHYKPLHYACKNNHVDVAKALLARGANANAKDIIGQTPLHIRCVYKHDDLVEAFIASGADFEAKDKDGQTPLDFVPESRKSSIMKLLEDARSSRGARTLPEAIDQEPKGARSCSGAAKGRLPKPINRRLCAAAAAGNGAEVIDRLGKGADPEAVDLEPKGARSCSGAAKGLLPAPINRRLCAAAAAGNGAKVIDLLRKGADANIGVYFGGTALHWASYHGHAGVTKALLAWDANVEARDGDGCTPLHSAIFWGHASVARVLLDGGADVGARDHCGRTPLQLAMEAEGKNSVLARLLEAAKLLGYNEPDARPQWFDGNWRTSFGSYSIAAHGGHVTSQGGSATWYPGRYVCPDNHTVQATWANGGVSTGRLGRGGRVAWSGATCSTWTRPMSNT